MFRWALIYYLGSHLLPDVQDPVSGFVQSASRGMKGSELISSQEVSVRGLQLLEHWLQNPNCFSQMNRRLL